jgi:aspartate racemase
MKVGIVGGIGPESTVDYYKSIIDGYQRKMRDDNYPEIVIDSVNMKEMLAYVSKRDWDSLVNMMIKSINSLAEVGADFAVIASNTPHVVFDRVKQIAKIPLLNIVEETCKKAAAINCKRLGLLGTSFTMRENFYKDTFAAHNKEIVLPNIDEQQYIHHKLFSEIELGIILRKRLNTDCFQ